MALFLALAESSIQLVPDGTIVFHIFLILVMVAVLNRTLFRPINQILAERETQTEGSMAEARSLINRVREKIREYEQRLREARSDGYQLLEQRRLESLRERQERVSQLKNEISSWIAQQKSELQREAQSARETLSQNSRELATQIAARILERPSTGNQE
jgi:F-type H+-transporting ATPase subunit b